MQSRRRKLKKIRLLIPQILKKRIRILRIQTRNQAQMKLLIRHPQNRQSLLPKIVSSQQLTLLRPARPNRQLKKPLKPPSKRIPSSLLRRLIPTQTNRQRKKARALKPNPTLLQTPTPSQRTQKLTQEAQIVLPLRHRIRRARQPSRRACQSRRLQQVSRRNKMECLNLIIILFRQRA